ncbi:MAG TPA: type II secretion system F family protein [Gemmatimonadaceae bacterium]|nr:type II secretion system F family protein [Gemmatimonadaceae bacterium]
MNTTIETSPTTFRYRAIDAKGHVRSGRLGARSRDAAMADLVAGGLRPIAISAESTFASGRSTLPIAETALALRILADLLDSGLPLARALATLETLASPRWRALLPGVRQAVREGRSLAGALSESSAAPPEVVIGIINAGERGSGLIAALRHAGALCEEAAATRSAVRSALAYPMLLAGAGSAAVVLLVGVVIPRFATILGDLGQSLPPSTRIVLGAAGVMRAAWLPSTLAAIVTGVLWYAWVSTAEGRRQWHAVLLRVPIIGAVRLADASARICTALSALLASGVAIAPALSGAARAAGDAELHARILEARKSVEQGERTSAALARHGAATELVVRLAQAGEESGRLADMLAHAARMERDRVTRQVRGAVRLIEPLLIIVFGGIVALVASALLQALYSVRPGA